MADFSFDIIEVQFFPENCTPALRELAFPSCTTHGIAFLRSFVPELLIFCAHILSVLIKHVLQT